MLTLNALSLPWPDLTSGRTSPRSLAADTTSRCLVHCRRELRRTEGMKNSPKDYAPGMNTTPEERLTRAALELAEEHGLDFLTVRRIATHAGINPGSVYYYFSSKVELIDTVVAAAATNYLYQIRSTLGATISHSGNSENLDGDFLIYKGLHFLGYSLRCQPNHQLLVEESVRRSLRMESKISRSILLCRPTVGELAQNEVANFLKRVADLSNISWRRPVNTIARTALASVEATIRRWHGDSDTAAAIYVLDEIIDYVLADSQPN
ncbi:TetR family transcriptional regulator [Rhodococcus erythropolis]|nr:TetR family transcriptional regulator [Rhodococcus erythropolis]